ncbi:MAG: TrkH family potassium uptake protein [Bacteroidales bacterium]|nr:TrkH family potassium uptake protein [Candidatus Colimorpha onthohippi]
MMVSAFDKPIADPKSQLHNAQHGANIAFTTSRRQSAYCKVSSNIKALVRLLGIFLMAEGVLMLLCLIPAIHFVDHSANGILVSGLFTLAVGLYMWISCSDFKVLSDRRLSFVFVVVLWLVLALFGSLPFLATGAVRTFTNAYFETLSGFTSSGATIFEEVQHLPSSILLWRSMSQWIGGFGIILLVLAIAPTLGINKFSLYTAETSIQDPSVSLVGTTGMTVRRMLVVYVLLSAIFVWLYSKTGLPLWDAVNLTFSNISSGGFSIYNDGIASLTAAQQYITALAMLLSGVNFTMLYLLISFRWNKIAGRYEQVRVYLLLFFIMAVLASVALHTRMGYGWSDSVRLSVVQSASVISTTGTMVADTSQWWMPVSFLFVILSLCGGMAGSTSGGIKVMRVMILVRNVRTILKNRLHPSAVNPVRLNGRPVAHPIINNVMVLFFVYALVIIIGVFCLILSGETGTEAIGAMVGCITGYGPGLGVSGGFGNYAAFADVSKWICIAAMLLGRLECITVLVLFYPPLWKLR